jgi:hypothetical protein
MLKLVSVKFFVGFFTMAALAVPQIAFGTTQPGIGIYSVSSYVVSAAATNGGTCGATPAITWPVISIILDRQKPARWNGIPLMDPKGTSFRN